MLCYCVRHSLIVWGVKAPIRRFVGDHRHFVPLQGLARRPTDTWRDSRSGLRPHGLEYNWRGNKDTVIPSSTTALNDPYPRQEAANLYGRCSGFSQLHASRFKRRRRLHSERTRIRVQDIVNSKSWSR